MMMGNLVMFRKDSVLNILSKLLGLPGTWERKGTSTVFSSDRKVAVGVGSGQASGRAGRQRGFFCLFQFRA